MAGAALRLSGNDGRFRGKLKMQTTNNVALVQEICSQTEVVRVKNMEDGRILALNEAVWLAEGPKAVLLDGQATLLVAPTTALDLQAQVVYWQACSKPQLKAY
jgi:hypothetical protein